MVDVSIVIPVYRDAETLGRTLKSLASGRDVQPFEIIVAHTAEDRDAIAAVRDAHAGLTAVEAARGRAPQMNAGAAAASGEWLLFLHADTVLPDGWREAIAAAGREPGVAIGCFRFALDDSSGAARLVEAGVRVRVALWRLPYGDQALFIRRSLFERLGGYARIPIMEDVELVRRARRHGPLYVSRLPATTSARRWRQQGWLGRTAVNLGLITLYACGVAPATLARLDRGRRL